MAKINAVVSKGMNMKLFSDSIYREDISGELYNRNGFAIFVDDVADCLTVTSMDLLEGGFDGALPCFVFDGSILGSFPYEVSTVIYEVLEEVYIPFADVSGINSKRLDLNWGGVDIVFWATPRLDGGVSLSAKLANNVLATNEVKRVNPFLLAMAGGVK